MENSQEMQPQTQGPYRRPIRPGLDLAARRAAQQREQQSKGRLFGRIPKSVVINFAALLILFGVVYALQTFGDKFRETPAATQPAAKSISMASLPAIPEAAPAPDAPAAQAQDPAPAAPSVYTLPQKQTAANAANNEEDAKPAIDVKKTAIAKKNAAIAQRQQGDAWAEDRNVAVDELDGESVRQRYNSQNKGVAYNPPPVAERPLPRYEQPAPRYTEPVPRASGRAEPSVYDLDGESARQDYLTANHKKSNWADEGKSEKKKAEPGRRPSDEDFIPYEQAR